MTSGHKSTHLGGPHKISAFNKQIATTFLFISKVNLIIFLGKKKGAHLNRFMYVYHMLR
jgi:hypothetical protein